MLKPRDLLLELEKGERIAEDIKELLTPSPWYLTGGLDGFMGGTEVAVREAQALEEQIRAQMTILSMPAYPPYPDP